MTDERKLEVFDSLCQIIFDEYEGCEDEVLLWVFQNTGGLSLDEAKEICGIK